jgi:protein-tyrosine-phosphatase
MQTMHSGQPTPVLKQTLRKVVPPSLLKERDTFLRLGPVAGPIYARLRLLDLVGVRSLNATRAKPGSRNFVFVCFGNLMRSPMAEAMFRDSLESAHLPGIRIASAGLHAVPGSEAHPWALTVSAELGLPLAAHRSRLLTADLVSEADAVFAMDFQNKAELLARYPECKNKMLMLSAYATGDKQSREISDPYFGNIETTRECYALLRVCVDNLTAALLGAGKNPAVAESAV